MINSICIRPRLSMVSSSKRTIDKIIYILTIALFSLFVAFETEAWGKYVFFALVISIFILSAIRDKKIVFRFGKYSFIYGIFTVFCFFSLFWSFDSSAAIQRANTLLQILVCSYFVFFHYSKKDNTHSWLRAIMWSGYITSIYAVLFYGIDRISESINDSIRLTNEFSNVNTIGLMGSTSIVIQLYEFMSAKKRWTAFFSIFPLIIIAASQSRKAIIYLFVGIVLLIVLYNIGNKKVLKNLVKVFVGLSLFIGLLFIASKIGFFDSSLNRLTGYINALTGKGNVDNSTLGRQLFIDYGLKYWKDYPIFGIGIGNSYFITLEAEGWETYLHNNFVELLATVGLVGFLIYYTLYIFSISVLLKWRKNNPKLAAICLTLLLLQLIMDYAQVSYFSKTTQFMLLLLLIEANNIRSYRYVS